MDTEMKRGQFVAWVERWRIAGFTALAIMVLVIVAAYGAWQSWGHITLWGRMLGEETAQYTAITVDGVMLVGGFMGMVDRLRGFRTRWWAVVCLLFGTSMSMVANVGSAWSRGWIAAAWSAVPAVGLFICVETLFHPSRRVIQAVKDVMAAAETLSAVTPAENPVPVAATGAVLTQTVTAPTEPTPAPEAVTPPKAPRKRSPRATTGPGTGSPRKRAAKAAPSTEPEVHNITTLRPGVDEVLPPQPKLNGTRPALALTPAFTGSETD